MTDPSEVTCPTCDAPPGAPCRTATGRTTVPHASREHEAEAADWEPADPAASPWREATWPPDPTAEDCAQCGANPGWPCLNGNATTHPHRPRWIAALGRYRLRGPSVGNARPVPGPLDHAGRPNGLGPADDSSPAPTTPLAAPLGITRN